jgi:transglutaminase-like putative cysteine protease
LLACGRPAIAPRKRLAVGDSLRLAVEHETLYHYGAAVEFAHHLAFLQPLRDAHQQLEAFELTVQPAPSHRSTGLDAWGNARTFFSVTGLHDTLQVRSASRVRTGPRFATLEAAASPAWEAVRDGLRYAAGAPYDAAAEFVAASAFVPLDAALLDYARPLFTTGRPVAQAAIELMHRVHGEFRYEAASTEVHTPVLQAFAQRRGVCQDFSHVMIGALRGLGLAAHYVSGYLWTRADGVDGGAVPARVGADASHAWVSVYCPGTAGVPDGWLDLDPTNDCVPDAGHIRLAVGRDYGDVAPLRGVIRGGGRHTLSVRVSTRLAPPPTTEAGVQLA